MPIDKKDYKKTFASLLNNWFTFSAKTHQYKTSSSVKGPWEIPIVNTKYYGKYSVRASTIISWNEIKKQAKDKFLSTFWLNQLKSLLCYPAN